MSAKRVLACSVVAFSVVLAVVVGNRMSAEAMAVVIGVVCGVTASIPMSAIMVALSRRSRPGLEELAGREKAPCFIIAPAPAAQPAAWPGQAQGYPVPAYSWPAVPAPREYRIVGDEPL